MTDKRAIKRYLARRDARLRKRGFRFDIEWDENKHPRDKGGRFASGNGGDVVREEKKSAGGGKSWGEMTSADIKVKGPAQSKKFINSYFKEHPEVKKEAEKYKDVFDNVVRFKERFPNAEDEHSYDAVTGEEVNVDHGHCVTFHQNFEIGNEYGGYDSDTYAAMCAIAMNELGAEHCYIGYFGNPEISFNCPDRDTARKFAIEHNQHSVFDAETFKLWVNPAWDEKTNPIRGKGSN